MRDLSTPLQVSIPQKEKENTDHLKRNDDHIFSDIDSTLSDIHSPLFATRSISDRTTNQMSRKDVESHATPIAPKHGEAPYIEDIAISREPPVTREPAQEFTQTIRLIQRGQAAIPSAAEWEDIQSMASHLAGRIPRHKSIRKQLHRQYPSYFIKGGVLRKEKFPHFLYLITHTPMDDSERAELFVRLTTDTFRNRYRPRILSVSEICPWILANEETIFRHRRGPGRPPKRPKALGEMQPQHAFFDRAFKDGYQTIDPKPREVADHQPVPWSESSSVAEVEAPVNTEEISPPKQPAAVNVREVANEERHSLGPGFLNLANAPREVAKIDDCFNTIDRNTFSYGALDSLRTFDDYWVLFEYDLPFARGAFLPIIEILRRSLSVEPDEPLVMKVKELGLSNTSMLELVKMITAYWLFEWFSQLRLFPDSHPLLRTWVYFTKQQPENKFWCARTDAITEATKSIDHNRHCRKVAEVRASELISVLSPLTGKHFSHSDAFQLCQTLIFDMLILHSRFEAQANDSVEYFWPSPGESFNDREHEGGPGQKKIRFTIRFGVKLSRHIEGQIREHVVVKALVYATA